MFGRGVAGGVVLGAFLVLCSCSASTASGPPPGGIGAGTPATPLVVVVTATPLAPTPPATPNVAATVQAAVQATVAAHSTHTPVPRATPVPTATIAPAAAAAAAPMPPATLQTTQDVIQRAIDFTAYIQTDSGEAGTGISIGNGLVLTAYHVLATARHQATVRFADGKTATATRLVKDARRDLAILITPDTAEPAATPIRSSTLRSPEPLYVIGFPRPDAIGSAAASVARGIFSGLWQSPQGVTFIQTDARIDPGNSGGPVIDSRGDLVGVVDFQFCSNSGLSISVAGCGTTGLNYAVSTDEVLAWTRELQQAQASPATATPPATEPQLALARQSGLVLTVTASGFLPNEPLTIRLSADAGPNCRWRGSPCVWHRVADADGAYQRSDDFTDVNGRGKYWYSISGDTSGRTALTTFELTAAGQPAPPADAAKPTIAVTSLPDGSFHVYAAGFWPNEALTEDLTSNSGCTLKDGSPCVWHFQADSHGVFDHHSDFSGLPPGQYWYSIHGDQSARFAPRTSISIQ